MILLGMIGTTEIILLVLLVVLFFGGRKIPELMRGLGKGVREFKNGLEGKTIEEEKNTTQKGENNPMKG